MKSKITIEIDFDNGNQPVLQIMQRFSDDVRDKLLQSFLQKFGNSSWCKIQWVNSSQDLKGGEDSWNLINITPLTPDDYGNEISVMSEQNKLNNDFKR